MNAVKTFAAVLMALGVLTAASAAFADRMEIDEIQAPRGAEQPEDNVLAEFGSVVHAVECAVEIQRELQSRNAAVPVSRPMRSPSASTSAM